jgi:Fe/S biogenesis protein NfuA
VSIAESFDVLSVTDEARAVVMDALASESSHEGLALWVEVTGTRGPGYAYDLYFSETTLAPGDAVVGRDGELTIVVPSASVERLRGSRLEYSSDGEGGLVLVNPNAPSREEMNPGVPEEILAMGVEGTLGAVAVRVLDEQVNPAIASHGGRADLVALDEGERVAYVRLSGGCQGCAMSRLTLSQGIESMLKEAIPELAGVVDVTDHASGANPFYAHE